MTSQTTSWDATNTVRTEVIVERTPAGVVASRKAKTFQEYPFGERLRTATDDPGGANLVTAWEYHAGIDAYGEIGRLHRVNYPDGNWTTYRYDHQGRIISTVTPWKNTSFDTHASRARAELHSYVPHDPRDTVTELDARPRTVEVKILNITVGKTLSAHYTDNGCQVVVVERCQRPEAVYGDADNLRTEWRYYPQGAAASSASAGRLHTVTYPHGARDTFAYEYGTWQANADPAIPGVFIAGTGYDLRASATRGTTASPAGIANRTLRNVTVFDAAGDEVFVARQVYTGTDYALLDWQLMTYDGLHRRISLLQSNGELTETTWNCCAKASETLPDGTQYTYAYDALRRLSVKTLVGIGDQADLVTTYTYDAVGNKVRETISSDNLSTVATWEYDYAGQLIKSIDHQGLITTYAYIPGINVGSNCKGRTVIETKPGGARLTRETFCDGQVSAQTGDAQTSQYYTYDVNANGSTWALIRTGGINSSRYIKVTMDLIERIVYTETPAFGNGIIRQENFYNNKNQIVKISETEKPDQLFVYDDLGNQIRSGIDLNQNGILDLVSNDQIVDIDYRYENNNLNWWFLTMKSTYGITDNSSETIIEITKNKLTGFVNNIVNEEQRIDIYGNVTIKTVKLERSLKRYIIEVLHPDSIASEQQIKINGREISNRSASNLLTTFTYDSLGRRISVTDSRIGTTYLTYHNTVGKIGLIQDVTNAAGNVISYDYDPITGRLIWERNSLGHYTRYAYNIQGQIVKIWGDSVLPVTFEYNLFGERIKMWTFHNNNVNWNKHNWPSNVSGDQTAWHYDVATGLLLSKVNAKEKLITYSYSPDGKLLRRTSSRGIHINYYYDNLGQVIRVNYSDTTPDVVYTYSRLGLCESICDAIGIRNFCYNKEFSLISEEINGVYSKVLTRNYTTNGIKGKAINLKVDNINCYTYGYDQYGRLNEISTQAGIYQYIYIEDGDLISQILRPNGVFSIWNYEDKRNLVSQVLNGTISSYNYVNDDIGRRISMSRNGNGFANSDTLTYLHDARNQLIEVNSDIDAAYSFSYGYDAIGNRLISDGDIYVSNSINQYTKINDEIFTYDDDGNILINNNWNYEWDGENRLIKAERDTVKLEFAYDYLGRRISKKLYENENLSKHIYFVYDANKLIEELDALNNNSIVRSYVWQPNEIGLDVLLQCYDANNNKTYFYQTDANKNITELTDIDGNIVAHYEYKPFGEQTNIYGVFSNNNPFRFSCEYFDEETALIYYNYRYFSPRLGRWLSTDPIEEYGGLNLYAFVENNPLSLIDELGTKAISLEFNGAQSPSGLSIYARGSIETDSCPESVKGSIFIAAEWQPPGLRYIKKPLRRINIHIEVGARAGLEINFTWNECDGVSEVNGCARVEVFAIAEHRRKGAKGYDGRFTRVRFGISGDGGGSVCYNFCDGSITGSLQFNYSAYAHFGNKNGNRSWSFGGGFNYSGVLANMPHLAFLAPYCNRSLNKESCCCKN